MPPQPFMVTVTCQCFQRVQTRYACASPSCVHNTAHKTVTYLIVIIIAHSVHVWQKSVNHPGLYTAQVLSGKLHRLASVWLVWTNRVPPLVRGSAPLNGRLLCANFTRLDKKSKEEIWPAVSASGSVNSKSPIFRSCRVGPQWQNVSSNLFSGVVHSGAVSALARHVPLPHTRLWGWPGIHRSARRRVIIALHGSCSVGHCQHEVTVSDSTPLCAAERPPSQIAKRDPPWSRTF